MLRSYEAMTRTEDVEALGFSMNFYQNIAASLEQSSCEVANFVCNGLFNTFQHCSTLFPHSYDMNKSRQKKQTGLNTVQMPRNFGPNEMQQQLQ